MSEHWESRPESAGSLAAVMIVALMLSAGGVAAQSTSATPITLDEAVQLALKNHPTIKESRARARAANEGVSVAQTAYFPRVDLLWQENRATRNNVFGLLLPQAIVPPISGPVLRPRGSDSVWSSAVGALLSWEAVDFGLRKASVDA